MMRVIATAVITKKNHAMTERATDKTGRISAHGGLELSLALVQFGSGLRFDVLYCGQAIGWIRVEDFGDTFGPRLTASEMRSQPYEGLDWNSIERLAGNEIVKMQTLDGSERRRTEHFMTHAFDFGHVPRSGSRRPGRPRDSLSLLAVRARSAFRAEHRGDEDRTGIDQARKRGLVCEGKLTPQVEHLLTRVDEVKAVLRELLKERPRLEQGDFVRALIPFRMADVDAAIWQLVDDGVCSAEPSTPAQRKLTGSRYCRVVRR
jgi:hypothetical protein